MPELPLVSGAQAVRALEQLGFSVVRQRGSHLMLRRGSTGCVVPLHRQLKRGSLSGILRQAGIDAESFIQAVNR